MGESTQESQALDHDDLMGRARIWVEQVVNAMGIASSVTLSSDYVEIEAVEVSPAIRDILLSPSAPDGEGLSPTIPLDALQYLANTILNLNQPESAQRSYTLEFEGYRQRRTAELQEMALQAVDHVRTTQTQYEFKSLSAAERRHLHHYFSDPDYADLETLSQGREPDRRLVLRLVGSEATVH